VRLECWASPWPCQHKWFLLFPPKGQPRPFVAQKDLWAISRGPRREQRGDVKGGGGRQLFFLSAICLTGCVWKIIQDGYEPRLGGGGGPPDSPGWSVYQQTETISPASVSHQSPNLFGKQTPWLSLVSGGLPGGQEQLVRSPRQTGLVRGEREGEGHRGCLNVASWLTVAWHWEGVRASAPHGHYACVMPPSLLLLLRRRQTQSLTDVGAPAEWNCDVWISHGLSVVYTQTKIIAPCVCVCVFFKHKAFKKLRVLFTLPSCTLRSHVQVLRRRWVTSDPPRTFTGTPRGARGNAGCWRRRNQRHPRISSEHYPPPPLPPSLSIFLSPSLPVGKTTN